MPSPAPMAMARMVLGSRRSTTILPTGPAEGSAGRPSACASAAATSRSGMKVDP